MSFRTLLVLVAPLAALGGQDAEPPARANQPPLVDLADLKIVQYQPEHADVYELEELVFEMVGREFYVVERGGYGSSPVANVRVLGSGLILYDEPAQLERMQAALKELDRPREAEPEPQREPLEVMHYVPRFLSLDAISVALKSFQREVDDGDAYIDNFSRSRERSLFVVRETPERMGEIRGVLERIDVPAPQIVVTCRLVRGEPGDEDAGVPDELLKHLKTLLPQMGFRAAGFSMLQTSVDPGQHYKLGLQDDRGAAYELSFAPVAYDGKTHSLSVAQCRLEDVEEDRTLFTTATILRGGEYTVLGATGAQPLFAVVRIQPVSP